MTHERDSFVEVFRQQHVARATPFGFRTQTGTDVVRFLSFDRSRFDRVPIVVKSLAIRAICAKSTSISLCWASCVGYCDLWEKKVSTAFLCISLTSFTLHVWRFRDKTNQLSSLTYIDNAVLSESF